MTRNISNRNVDFFDAFGQFIKESRNGRRLQPNGKRFTAGSVNNYEFTEKLVRRFSIEKDLGLRIIPVRRLNTREMEREKNYWKKFYRRFTDWLYNQGYYDNYVGMIVKNIRTFFNYLNRDKGLGVGEFHKQFYVRKEEIAIHPLTPEELRFFTTDAAFEETLSKRLREVKDFFVFGCTVALRFSDLSKLTNSNIRKVGQNCYLAVRSVKTATDTLVKLPPYAIAIIERYSKNKKKLLPAFNKVNLNKYLKILMERAGFTQTVSVVRSRRGRMTEIKGSNSQSLSFAISRLHIPCAGLPLQQC